MSSKETLPLPEKRRIKRTSAWMPVTLLAEANGQEIAYGSLAIDLSALGARVRTSVPLLAGQKIGMVSSKVAAHPLLTRVVWVKPTASEHTMEVGLEFLHPLRTAALSGKLIIYKAVEPGADFEIKFIPYIWKRDQTTPARRITNQEELVSFLCELDVAQEAQQQALLDLHEPYNLDAVIQNLRLGFNDLRNQNLLP